MPPKSNRKKQPKGRPEPSPVKLPPSPIPFPSRTVSIITELVRQSAECGICLCKLKRSQLVSSCSSCHHIFHLHCIREWSSAGQKTTADDHGNATTSYKCPLCNHPHQNFALAHCFCGKNHQRDCNDPFIPHACGSTCNAFLCQTCSITCSLPCHPGACHVPPCSCNTPLPTPSKQIVSKSLISKASTSDNFFDSLIATASRPSDVSVPRSTAGVCRCGKEVDPTRCTEVAGKLQCRNFCRQKLSCKKHVCNKQCCSESEHMCFQVCSKLLNCKRHHCQSLCHSGKCRDCDVNTGHYQCVCGSVVVDNLLCGDQPPTCLKQCPIKSDCNHPNYHDCHSKATPCPPCNIPSTVLCKCQQTRVSFWPCSRTPPTCSTKCNRLLRCMYHLCDEKCLCSRSNCYEYQENSLGPCQKQCHRKRSCGHLCEYQCHPELDCQSVGTCLVSKKFSCECGRQSEVAECGSSTELTCDESCREQIERSLRNARLASALGLSNVVISTDDVDDYADSDLLIEARYQVDLIDDVEKVFLTLYHSKNGHCKGVVHTGSGPKSVSKKKFVEKYALNRPSPKPPLLSTLALPFVIPFNDMVVHADEERILVVQRILYENVEVKIHNVMQVFKDLLEYDFHLFSVAFSNLKAYVLFPERDICVSLLKKANAHVEVRSKYSISMYEVEQNDDEISKLSNHVHQILDSRANNGLL
ncbi:hypothetical protein GEMRC1_006937 [Eukaryota sp. GEM-RC1]